MSDIADLARALRADHCHGIVTRDGEQDACGEPPVAVIDGRGTEDETYWPACAYHANRYGGGRCVPLGDLAAAVLREAADVWTQGAWSDVMLPKPVPPAVPVIAYANRMGDWLRARADREVTP